ncbi:MAG: bifunctional 3-demethylubiquinol 3-O-methyltransferase/2-polyprenyl-6-hydroxyphenol methylase [Gammaproteobacteria bacterium RIFCSPHIGHO2_12_FULL_40_19]|nr:MAG: bifunctional 3-demethylubiquinol 3-O-methyltransferase/2-polyprenyl-6-hydroxyphenol methylase [Gammaproteobacteria bacterium RIFCSPHIGHO2_12_FULL_40_19]
MNMNTHNVDANEIAKFSALASEWWDLNGPMKPLHALNPLRLHYIQKHAEIAKKNVLDMGCGGGILTESLAKAGAITTGIDMSHDAIQIAKQHATQSQLIIHYEKTRIEDFATMHPNTFDVITCMEMLEHVPDPCAIIQAASQLLKPNGLLFLSTINRNIKAFLSAVVGAEYILNLLPKGTHHYEKFIRPSELNQWAEKNNLVLRGLQGIDYHPFKNTFEMTDSVDVNYFIYFQANEE